MFRRSALAVIVLAVLALVGCSPEIGGDQRGGLVETALMFEATDTHYPSGAEYAQAVYASQDIEISTDILEDSYPAGDGALRGDIVIGADYVGIRIDDQWAMGVPNEGGPVQAMRLTDEEVRRVDW